jgi:hypothetical protein
MTTGGDTDGPCVSKPARWCRRRGSGQGEQAPLNAQLEHGLVIPAGPRVATLVMAGL